MKVVHAWCLEPVEQADLGGATNPNLSPPLRRACRVDCSTFFRCPPLAGANCSWFALAFLAIDPVPCWMGVRGSTKPTTRLIFRVEPDRYSTTISRRSRYAHHADHAYRRPGP